MQARLKKPIWKLASLASAAVLTVGCQAPAPTVAPSSDRQFAQAEKLAGEQQYAAAARAYEASAARQAGDLHNRVLLRAAREWARAEDIARAQTLLQQIGEQLPPADLTLRHIVAGEVALLARQPDRALTELDRIAAPLPRAEAPEILALRTRALFAYGRPLGAVMTALDREQLLSAPADIERNRRMLWDGIERSAASGVDLQAPPGANRMATGWMELGRAALALGRNPFAAQVPINEWRTKYPEHPANDLLNRYVLPQLDASLVYPDRIALLLPLSGSQQANGAAVRDGFLSASLQHVGARRPNVRIYDTAKGALTAYNQALADGARFIVGPLIKEDIAQIIAASAGNAPQPTSAPTPLLALNTVGDNPVASSSGAVGGAPVYQFALNPTDEAEQAAERIFADGKHHAIVFTPSATQNSDWGPRVQQAFAKRFEQLGGKIAATQSYDSTTKDFSAPVKAALLINESQARATALNNALGAKLEFEPRVRADIDAIFLAAEPAPGRLIKPTLRFNLLDELPIYATSNIFDPDSSANAELNGVMFTDIPWIVAPDDAATQMRNTLAKYWSTRMRGNRSRLFAFGFDAYRLIPVLQAHRAELSASAIPGMTGMLSIDKDGRVRRQLEWARVRDGRAQLIVASEAQASVPRAQ